MNPDDITTLDGPSVASTAKRAYTGPHSRSKNRTGKGKAPIIKLRPKRKPRGRHGY